MTPADLDWLRWEVEGELAADGWTDRVACLVWGSRFLPWMMGRDASGLLDAVRLLADPQRVSRTRDPMMGAVRWSVPVADEDAY